MKNDDLLCGLIEDRLAAAEEKYMMTHTDFLDPHERAVADRLCRSGIYPDVRKLFRGGYADAERTVLICLPPYVEDADKAEDELMTVLRASVREGGRPLRHGDYLGSLTALGLDRGKTGDILVRGDGADIIVLQSVAEFLMANYARAGRSYLSLEQHPLSELIVPEQRRQVRRDTVASLRLDSIVSAAFGLPRSRAQEAIRQGLVFVNSMEVLKPDRPAEEGDRIVLRGSGRILLTEAGGRSRKDRLYISYEKY